MECLLKSKLLLLYFFTNFATSIFIILIIYLKRTYLYEVIELNDIRNFLLKENISIGIISNPLINPKNKKNFLNIKNLKNAFNTFKQQKVNVIVILGNLLETPDDNAYKQFNNIYYEYFHNLTFPFKIFMMGENLYEKEYKKIEKYQKKFHQYLNQSYCEKLRIGIYNFIKFSYYKSKNNSNINWLKKELSKTIKTNPIFVLTSIDENNYKEINDVLKNYNNIILIDGNSKYSLIDERSISKKNYITINVQNLSYINLHSN